MNFDNESAKRILADNYDALAAEYERAAVPVLRPVAKRMLQLIDLRPGWQVLDAGTGTGLVALLGAPRVTKSGKMIGIDASEKMLELAREKAARFGFTQCEFRVGDLEALDFPEGQFNAALSQFALHHVDPQKSMREFYRVMMPGGLLAIQEWADTANTPNQVLSDTLLKYRADEVSDALQIARAQSERARGFRESTATQKGMSELARGAGFSDARAQEEQFSFRAASADAFIDFASAAPLVHAELASLPENVRASLLSEARHALRPFENPNGFEWTYNVVSLVARK